MLKLKKTQSDDLYRLIKFVHDLLTKAGITYWITGGTLLGAVRHTGLIPWDDDADICILKKDLPKLKKLIKPLADLDVDLSFGDGNWYIGHNQADLGMDIFIMETLKKRTTFSDKGWRQNEVGGVKCYFLNEHLFPLLPVKFGNFYVFAPNNSMVHLNTCYKPNWNSHSAMLYNHRTGIWENTKPKK